MSYSFRVIFNDQGEAIVTNAAGDPPAGGAYFYVSGHGAQSLGVSLQSADGLAVLQAGAFCPAADLTPAAPTPDPVPAPAPTPAPAPSEAPPTIPDPPPSSPPAYPYPVGSAVTDPAGGNL